MLVKVALEQTGLHFTDGIFLNVNYSVFIQILLKIVPSRPIDYISAFKWTPLVQVMAWHLFDEYPLSDPRMTHCQLSNGKKKISGILTHWPLEDFNEILDM